MKEQLSPTRIMRILKQANQDGRLLEKQVHNAAHKWHKQPPQKLNLTFQWNLNPEQFHYSLDGTRFNLQNQTTVAYLQSEEVYALLHRDNIIASSLWHPDHIDKTARLYEWIHRGYAITPPFICFYQNTSILITGGLHRFYLARENGEENMPFIIYKHEIQPFKDKCPSMFMLE